jgi:anti-anti-sigma regulatory factor
MPTIAEFFKINAESVTDGLQEARAKLDSAPGETVLDFSCVQRIAPQALRAMEELADVADAKGIKVGLHGVNVEIYKVLKLVRLAPRFCFLT